MNLRQLATIARSEHGPAPAFEGVDLPRAVWEIGKSAPISRQELSAALSIGEGSTRSVIAALSEKGLVEIVKKGCILSGKGLHEYASMARAMETAGIPPCPATFSHPAFAILLKGAAGTGANVLAARDAAVRMGALGATITIMEGKLVYAGAQKHAVDAQSTAAIMAAFSPTQGDAVVLGYSPSPLLAQRGTWAAAMEES